MANLDDTDTKLVAILRRDARRPLAKLAHDLGVARATVRARLERLIADGVIRGFTVVLRDDAEERSIGAIMMLGIEGKRVESVMRQLAGLPEVRSIHSTNGRWDLVIELSAPDLPSFDKALSRIRMIDGVSASETSLLLARHAGTPRSRF